MIDCGKYSFDKEAGALHQQQLLEVTKKGVDERFELLEAAHRDGGLKGFANVADAQDLAILGLAHDLCKFGVETV